MGLKVRSIGLAATLVAGSVATVAATAPERNRFSDTFEDVAFESCDGYDLLGTGEASGVEALFIDADGNERIRLVFSISITWTRSDTGEVVGTEFGHSVLLAPLDGTPQSTWVGIRAKGDFTSGDGFLEVGYIYFDTNGDPAFVAGPHPLETGEATRCDYVAG